MIVDRLINLFAATRLGLLLRRSGYEAERAYQSAYLARQAGAADSLVAAALLHDVGHLLHNLGEDVAERGIDARHEDAGAAWLADHFGRAVADPVRLHVAAKRYLCAAEPTYCAGLSPASLRSLQLQGGPFTVEEMAALSVNRTARNAAGVASLGRRGQGAGAGSARVGELSSSLGIAVGETMTRRV
jgi:predicted HD phosphohydrolase